MSFQTMCYLSNGGRGGGGEGRGELKKKRKKTPRYFSRHQVYLSSYIYFSYKQSIKAELLFASSLTIENRYLIPKTTVTEHFILKKTPLLSSNGQRRVLSGN